MLALDSYENSRTCSLCGLPTSFCHDENHVRQAFSGGDVETCFVTQMREKAVKQFEESGTVQYPNSNTTTLIPKTE